jgi:hypothetical protein
MNNTLKPDTFLTEAAFVNKNFLHFLKEFFSPLERGECQQGFGLYIENLFPSDE